MRQIDEEALRELLTRGNQRTPGEMLTMVSAERMRLEFRLYARRCWHLIEPKYLAWNWHMDAVCLPPDALITTEAGPMPIGDLVSQRWQGRVLSYDHVRERAEWRRVTAHMSSPGAPLVRVRFSGREIEITENHPVFVVGLGYIRADELRPGNKVLHLRALQKTVPSAQCSQPILQPEVLRTIESQTRDGFLSAVRPSPHRSSSLEQRALEFSDAVSALSWQSTRDSSADALPSEEIVQEVVRSVRVCDSVYNIEVDGNHNYVANGVLVHNCDHLVWVTQGEIRFLMIMIPPRMTKSLIATVIWPSWHWIPKPQTQFIGASYSADLALEHAGLSRRLIQSTWYQNHFGGEWFLRADENRRDMFRNSAGGYRLTTSVSGRTTGEGGDIQLLDDPHDAKKVESDSTRQSTLEWHDNAWRSRLNDPNKSQKVYVAQRTHDHDVMGHVMEREGNRWVQLMMPMEFDPKRKCITYLNRGTGDRTDKKIFEDPRKVEGELLNPKRFNKETAKTEKVAMSTRAWNAQYAQQPEGAGGLILKRQWWRPWVNEDWEKNPGQARQLPEFSEVIQVYDTAFEADEEDDFTARTTWGIFPYRERIKTEDGKVIKGQQRICALLLDYLEERMEYPDLVDEVVESDEYFAPDKILVEKKASGHSLIHELRKKKLPVKAVGLQGSGKGRAQADLIARAHESSLMLKRGCIWYVPEMWSFHVIEHCAKFPNGDHDDITSTATLAWQWMRQFYDLTLPDDEKEEIQPFGWKKKPKLYA